jgi:DNA-binding NarL/FixJ family response regulator
MSDSLHASDVRSTIQQTIRVVVADDHPIVRRGITSELSRAADIVVVGEAVDGDEALRLAQGLVPDVLVLDISMPGLHVVEVLHLIALQPAPPRILILTAHNDLEYVREMLKAGVKGYLLKEEDPATIIAAVRAIARGGTWLSADVAMSVLNHAVGEPAETSDPRLSTREAEVLRLLSTGKHNQEIGAALGIHERTVRYHLHNIYDKLGVQWRGEAIAWAVRRGIEEA